jgi:mannitol operon repressor
MEDYRMKIAIFRTGGKEDPRPFLAVGKELAGEKKNEASNPEENSIDHLRLTVENAPAYLKGFVGLLEVAASESDRGTVLVYATMLDEQLKEAIDAFLVDHSAISKLTEGFNAPIGTFSTRTLLAFGLGLISEREYCELETVRKIRNEFAHSINMSFECSSVSSRCKSLSWAIPEYPAPRDQFVAASASLVLNLLNRAHYAAQKRLSYRDWAI